MTTVSTQFKEGENKNDFVAPQSEALNNLFKAMPEDVIVDGQVTPKEEEEKDADKNKDLDKDLDKDNPEDKDKDKDKEEPEPDKDKDKDKDKGGEGDEEPILETLASKFNVELELDEDKATEDLDGIIHFFEKRDEQLLPELKKQGIQELFEALPVVQELVQHLAEGYGIDSFKAQIQTEQFKEIDVETAEEKELIRVYTNALKTKGIGDAEIEVLVESARDSGKLKENTKAGQDYLKGIEDEKIEKTKLSEKARNDAEAETSRKVNDTLKDYIKENKIGNIKITPEAAKRLEDHLFGKTKEGRSKREEAWSNLTLEKQAILEHIIASDFKDTGLVEDKSTANHRRMITVKKKAEQVKQVDLKTNQNVGLDVKSLFNPTN